VVVAFLRSGSAAASLLCCVGLFPGGGHGCLSVMSVVCCRVEVSATGRSLVQRSRTECLCVSLGVIRRNSNSLQE